MKYKTLGELIDLRMEAMAGRAPVITPLERAVAYYESEEAFADFAVLRAALEEAKAVVKDLTSCSLIASGQHCSQCEGNAADWWQKYGDK